jgi:hypothetical protein
VNDADVRGIGSTRAAPLHNPHLAWAKQRIVPVAKPDHAKSADDPGPVTISVTT